MAMFGRSGTLQGTDTPDTVIFSVDLPVDIPSTVTAGASGDNALPVRSGQKLAAVWAQIHDFEVGPGDTGTRSFSTNIDGTLPTSDLKQDIRIRPSRKVLTREIDGQLSWTVT